MVLEGKDLNSWMSSVGTRVSYMGRRCPGPAQPCPRAGGWEDLPHRASAHPAGLLPCDLVLDNARESLDP